MNTRLLSLLLLPISVFAVNRSVTINAPTTIYAGQAITVPTSASTDATDAEQIGFYHADYSTNGGASWSGFCYDVNVGKNATRNAYVTAGSAGTQILIRVKIAFRWGGAGDRDYTDTPIDWGGTWGSWSSPSPTKYATIDVIAAPNVDPEAFWQQPPTPGSALTNQWFQVQARAEDDDGNLATIFVWRDETPFAFNSASGYESFSDANGANISAPGSTQFKAQSSDATGATSPFILHTVTIDNQDPYGSFTVNGSSGASSVNFGQTVSVSSIASDDDNNLATHSFYWDQGNGSVWTHPILTGDYAPNADGWLNLNLGSNGYDASGDTSPRDFDFRATHTGTFVFHCAAADPYKWVWMSPVQISLTVNKTTPNTSFPNRTIATLAPNYTVQASDLNALFSNPYSGSVAVPTGPVNYTIISGGSGAVTAGTSLTAGSSYTIRATYSGDSNYHGVTVDASWVLDDPFLDVDGDGMPDNWESSHGLNPNSGSDASLDADGDGWSNVAEYNRDSDPNVYNAGTSVIGNTVPAGWTLADADPNTVVGTTTGQISVDQSGALSYTIPFWTTPGTAGMEPKVSLNYSNQSGIGIAGFGWSLGGISAITRGPQTLAVDGVNRGVTLTGADRFYLDGQRLIKIGSGGVDYGSENSEYRTELESITKVIAKGTAGSGPAWFQAWTKSGLIIEYGNTLDSAFDAAGKAEKHHWRVNKISDTVGNFMKFTYAGTAADGPHRVTRIDYTGNGTTVTTYASLRFEYENRTDWSEGYIAGSMISNRNRLKHVKSFYGETVARTYTLGYTDEAVTGRSLLTSITEVGKDGSPYPDMVFDYEDNTLGWSSLSTAFEPQATMADNVVNNGNGWPTGAGTGFIDLNADGRTDFVQAIDTTTKAWLNTETGWTLNANYALPQPLAVSSTDVNTSGGRFVDVNGDGFVDYIYRKHGSDGLVQQNFAYINKGPSEEGWTETAAWRVPAPIGRDGAQNDDPYRGGRFLDINGDGLVDFVTYMTDGVVSVSIPRTVNLAVYLNNGSSFNSNPDSGYSTMSTNLAKYQAQFVDLNGDGLPDIACHYDDGSSTPVQKSYLNTGLGWSDTSRFYLPQPIATGTNNLAGAEFMDVNGDGLPDLVWYREPTSSTPPGGCLLNTGANSGTIPGAAWIDSPTYAPTTPLARDNYRSAGTAVIDFNADGIPDFGLSRYFSANENAKQTSYGTHRAPFGGTGHDLPTYLLKDGEPNMGVDFVDIDADGAVDVLWNRKLSNGQPEKGAQRNLSSPIHGRLKKVTNGLGVSVDVNYAALTEDGVYTKASDNSDLASEMNATERAKVINMTGPMYVVREVINDNGAGGTHTLTYSYANLRGHRERGSLGFGWMKVLDSARDIRTQTTYRQDYPFIGQAKYVKVTHASDSDNLLSEVTTTWNEKILTPGNRRLLYATPVVEKSYDLTTGVLYLTTTTTTGVPSDYGDVLTLTVSTSDGFTKTSTNEYEDADEINWILGRLETAEVVSIALGQPSVTRNSSFTYNSESHLLETEKIEPGVTELELTTTYGYDQFGNKESVTVSGSGLTIDEDGEYVPAGTVSRTTTTQYDANGRFPDWTKNALNHVEKYNEYDEEGELVVSGYDQVLGVLTHMSGANDLETDWFHDGFGRQVLEIRSDNTETTTLYGWTPASTLADSKFFVETESPGSAPSRTHFDKLGRARWSQSINGTGKIVMQETQYDALGRAAGSTVPYYNNGSPVYWSSTTYDLLDRPKIVTTPDDENGAQSSSYSYDGFKGIVTDPKSRETETIRNSQGWVTSNIRNKTAGTGETDYSSTTYNYDAIGNLRTTVAAGTTTTLTYDARGRKISMIDADMGTWEYRYNVFGELIWQKDAEDQITTMDYDVLGRLVLRSEEEEDTSWTYDTSPIKGTGKLHTVSAPGNYSEIHLYDAQGRPSQVQRTIDGLTYSYQTSYDGSSRPNRLLYPATGVGSPFSVRQVYNDFGYLKEIRAWLDTDTTKSNDELEGRVYWMADSYHVSGRVDGESYGNGTSNDRYYSAATGRLRGAYVDKASILGAPYTIQQLSYEYDSVGNVERRYDAAPGVNRDERFYTGSTGDGSTDGDGYDGLDRLKVHRIVGGTTVTVGYAQNGNITSKSDVGTYAYVGYGPHAVTSAGGQTGFTYDKNGNMLTGLNRTLQWTSFNQLKIVSDNSSNKVSEFSFGANHERVKQVRKQGTIVLDTTIYGGSLYEKITTASSGLVEHKHYVMAPSGRIAVYTSRSDLTKDLRYFHTDGLGSITAVTDEKGTVLTRYAYDAWGKQTTLYTNAGSGITNQAPSTRGFTDHEMLSDQGVIHMNGRVYDPVLGRFLSADPYVESAADAQSYNRYSYVGNNPLGATDPTGYFSFKDFVKIVAVVAIAVVTYGAASSAVTAGITAVKATATTAATYSIGGIAISASSAGVIASAAGGLAAGFASGFAGSLLNGGSLGDAFQSGVIGGVIGGISAGVGAYVIRNLPKNLKFLTKHSLSESATEGFVSGATEGALKTAFYGGNLGQNSVRGAFKNAVGNGAIDAATNLWRNIRLPSIMEKMAAKKMSELEALDPDIAAFARKGIKQFAAADSIAPASALFGGLLGAGAGYLIGGETGALVGAAFGGGVGFSNSGIELRGKVDVIGIPNGGGISANISGAPILFGVPLKSFAFQADMSFWHSGWKGEGAFNTSTKYDFSLPRLRIWHGMGNKTINP